jgi:1,2-dihydroxy-3-keto-5-methylthiopentene dioxygenase
MPKAYYISNPSHDVTLDDLKKIGVLYWKLDADDHENDPQLKQIRLERGYTYKDEVVSSKIPNLDDKLKIFFEEHLHDDEEIRFFLDGTGYFDVREEKLDSCEDNWIRIELSKGDMIVLPAGIYHRFTADDKKFFHVMRLFVGDPVWTPHNRVDKPDTRPSRLSFLKAIKT